MLPTKREPISSGNIKKYATIPRGIKNTLGGHTRRIFQSLAVYAFPEYVQEMPS
jgi:hypothetical protein